MLVFSSYDLEAPQETVGGSDSKLGSKAPGVLQDIVDMDVESSLALLLSTSGAQFKENVQKWAAVNLLQQRSASSLTLTKDWWNCKIA